jgi:acetolactate synthase-1/2/3 large subunit
MDMVGRAERPVFVVGGSRWNAAATVSIRRFAESHGIPIATAARNQDLVDNTSEVFVGTLGLGTTPGLGDLMKEADLVALIGTRPDALTTEDSSWLTSPRPTQRLVHVHPDPNVLNKVFASDLSIVSCPSSFAAALISQRAAFAPDAWLARLRENRGMVPSSTPNQTDPAAFMNVLNARLPQNAIMTAGAGAYTSWHQRYRTYSTYPSQVATQSGSMGYGLPAAIAAKLVHPERAVVAFGGDGCFLMTGVELATAARYRLAITVIVINNSRYGTIRAHQDANFPGRVSGTDLVNPHFAQFARSFGLPAETVRTPREFESALGRLLGRNEPTLIEIVVP